MGTRSTTLFVEKGTNSKTGGILLRKVCKFYRQMDGYPEGHGMDLAEILATGELVNGFGIGSDKVQFNGIGCLAAQVIKGVKHGTGGIYMIPVSDGGEEYNYEIIVHNPYYKNDDNSEPITIKVKEGRKVIFKGTPKEFIEKFGDK